MPIYEYLCQRCGRFESALPMEKAGGATTCPTCGQKAERQYIFNTSVGLTTIRPPTPPEPPPTEVAPGLPGPDWSGISNLTLQGGSVGVEVGLGRKVVLDSVRFEDQSVAGIDNAGEVRMNDVDFE